MRFCIVSLTLLFLIGANMAEAQTREDLLRCRAVSEDIRRLGCYDRLRLPREASGGGKYESITLEELKGDLLGYRGQLVDVSGRLIIALNRLSLSLADDDPAPVPLDVSAMSRNQRQAVIDACGEGCQAVVRGTVGPVAFTTGIVADSVSIE